MSCQKARAAGSKLSPTRQAYTPKKIGTAMPTVKSSSQFGSPKVRMSFGSRNR